MVIFREAINLAQANRRSRGRLRHSWRNCRWNELSRSPRQGCRNCRFHSERIASGIPGNANLSLSRPLDVGPCKLPVPNQELEKYRLDDPITRLRAQLTREGKLTNEQLDPLDKRAKETALVGRKIRREEPSAAARYALRLYICRRNYVGRRVVCKIP